LRPGEPQAGNGDLDERTTVDLDLHTTIRYRQEVLADLLADAELETYSDCVRKLARPSRLAQK
ncbi:unnamed protein product, partial [marine sediment metagenome]